MVEISLKKYGSYLAGRSIAIDIINEEKLEERLPLVMLDLKDVKGISQSFIAELFLYLRRLQVKQVEWINVSEKIIEEKLQFEASKMKKLSSLLKKSDSKLQ